MAIVFCVLVFLWVFRASVYATIETTSLAKSAAAFLLGAGSFLGAALVTAIAVIVT